MNKYGKKNCSKSDKTKETFEKVVAKLQTIIDNGDYEKFLKFQKNFRNYSFNNLILIFSQFPDATKVAGKTAWKKLDRDVTENAKKIFILAPIPHKYTKKVKTIKDGEETEKTETIEYNSYRYVFVYDVSQTTGKPIPLANQNINCDDMAYFYEKLKNFSKVPVFEQAIEGAAKGYFSPKQNKIVIRNTLSSNDKAAVLLHEISHSLYDDFDYSKDRDLSEVFVESISYIVADHFGLDTSCCSFNYIIKWANGEPQKVIDLGNKIQKCAKHFIKELENFEMQELELVA